MRHPRPLLRRGVALLFVLAALMVAVTTAVGAARLASISMLERRGHAARMLADAMLKSAEAPIEHWLLTESSHVVLADDAGAPVVEVLHDAWKVDGVAAELRITAWDQLGMVPLDLAGNGSMLRSVLPPQVREAVDALDVAKDGPHGLDLFIDDDDSIQVFPQSPQVSEADEPALFTPSLADPGSPAAQSHGLLPSSKGSEAGEPKPMVGAHVATHDRQPYRINVNTAPMTLVEAAMRLTGRGGAEVIWANRREARMSSGELVPRRSENDDRLLLVASSDAWGFRIDITVNNARRSWWTVYERDSGKGNQSGATAWQCVQQLLITE